MDTINILWTGGWDSTYRVLYAAIVQKKRVFPHYIVDVERISSLRELQTISEVRNALRAIDAAAAARIEPLKIIPIDEIPADSQISKLFQGLRKKSALGSQYDWLARYACFAELHDLELSVHVDDKAYFFLEGNVEATADGSWRLKAGVLGPESIFSRFTFPLLEISKTEMKELATRYGFIDALELAWFCHRPASGMPCGVCNPCIYTIEEGMGYRLPPSAKFRYKTRSIRKLVRLPGRVIKRLTRYL